MCYQVPLFFSGRRILMKSPTAIVFPMISPWLSQIGNISLLSHKKKKKTIIIAKRINQNHQHPVFFWLVVGPPLWKIWTSIGMIRTPIYGKIKNGNQTTNQFSTANRFTSTTPPVCLWWFQGAPGAPGAPGTSSGAVPSAPRPLARRWTGWSVEGRRPEATRRDNQ